MAGITIERILALHAAYIRCIDRDELEAWPISFSIRAFMSSPAPRTTARDFRAA
jgi:hypothetical protein